MESFFLTSEPGNATVTDRRPEKKTQTTDRRPEKETQNTYRRPEKETQNTGHRHEKETQSATAQFKLSNNISLFQQNDC